MEEAKSSREPSRARSLLKPVFCLVSAFLALFFILLATSSIAELDIGRLLPFRPSGDSCDCRNQQQQRENDRSRTVNFTEHIKYKSLNRDFDVVWDQLLPSNGGFILFRDQDNKKHKYGMSMFHQLHCLSMLRMAMQEFNNTANGAATATPAPEHHHHQRRDQQGSQETPNAPHWLHCFDYLRQAILCKADDTIEPPKLNRKKEEVVDGMIQRECKDWDVLYKASTDSDVNPVALQT